MAFTAEWVPEQDLWEERKYAKHDEINYVRVFLGHHQVYVQVKDVLVFETAPGVIRTNPFIKQAMDGIHYNQIEIIAFDDGSFGGETEYRKILDQCGYPYIKNITVASGRGKCGFQFFKKMISIYHSENKKYGMIANRMIPFAKVKHLDFLLYKSPDVYEGRYDFGKHKKPWQKFFENFVNEQLFCGKKRESRGYHFGFAFEGIWFWSFCRFVKETALRNGKKKLYFTTSSDMAYEAYTELYPGDSVQVLYADSLTERNRELDGYLNGTMEKDGLVVDFSDEEDWKKYLQNHGPSGTEVVNFKDFFFGETLKKYGEEILKAAAMAETGKFHVRKYESGIPVWKQETGNDVRNMRNSFEIQRGILDFVQQFQREWQRTLWEKRLCKTESAGFCADVLAYAFDENRRCRQHGNLKQGILNTAAAKKAFHVLKGIYRRIRKR